jgi:putative hydrolase of HD superfamily
MDNDKLKSQFEFINKAGELKRIKRRGWVECKVKDPESVAEHSQRIALIALLLADENNVDKGKVVQMALIHDHPEIITLDISPAQNVPQEEKSRLEDEAMKKLCMDVDGGKEIYNLWREFEDDVTEEAKFVHVCDKIEAMFQAYEYGLEQPDKDLSQFWNFAEKYDFKKMTGLFQFLKLQAKK